MDEVELIVLIVKALWWIVRTLFLVVTWPLRVVWRAVRAPIAARATPAAKKSAPPPVKGGKSVKLDDVVVASEKLAHSAKALSAVAAEQNDTQTFTRTLDALVARLGASLMTLRRNAIPRAAALHTLQRESALRRMVGSMVEERRGAFADLLADTDALANASYAPIVEFCDRRGIALASDRAATVIDGDKLFFMSVDDPSGLTAIVLPSSFSTELMTWPAIAHEIGHDFFHSVGALPQQLRARLSLGDDIKLPAANDGPTALRGLPTRATAAWMEELFADSFGTMMLGPAYIETMMASFGSPAEPSRALACAPREDRGGYEEHPPGHVRVVSGCRLLAQMGYGKIADELEARWRKQHGNPAVLFVPLADGRWLRIDEAPVLDRAAQVGSALYMEGLPALRGLPLRSIAGLDFGPREHESARRVAERLQAGRPANVRDARLLVAGAVLATVRAPQRAAEIYALARDGIGAVDATRTPRVERGNGALPTDELRDAIVFGELMAPPLSRRSQRRP